MARINFVPNPRAATSVTGYTNNAATGAISQDATQAAPASEPTLTTAIKAVLPGTNSFEGIVSSNVSIDTKTGFRVRGDAPQPYYFSAWIKSSVNTSNMTMQVEERDKNDLSVGNRPVSGTFPLTSTWTQFGGKINFTTAGTMAKLQFYFSPATATTIWVTGIMLEAASVQGTFFDGASAGSGWLGTANASASKYSTVANVLPQAQWPTDTQRISSIEMRGQDSKGFALGEGSASQSLARTYFFNPPAVVPSTRRRFATML